MNMIQDNINLYYFANESRANDRYFKQKMAMVLYNHMNTPGTEITTLKLIWEQINLYYWLLDNPQHVVNPSHEYFMAEYYGQKSGQYTGD